MRLPVPPANDLSPLNFVVKQGARAGTPDSCASTLTACMPELAAQRRAPATSYARTCCSASFRHPQLDTDERFKPQMFPGSAQRIAEPCVHSASAAPCGSHDRLPAPATLTQPLIATSCIRQPAHMSSNRVPSRPSTGACAQCMHARGRHLLQRRSLRPCGGGECSFGRRFALPGAYESI